jgi:adenylate kinase family enzyme
MNKQIITISGPIGSGKDTIAQYLEEYHGFTKLSFAGPLKDAAAAVFGWDREMVEGTTAENRAKREAADSYWTQCLEDRLGQEVTPRFILQWMGTELFRNHLHRNIWVLSMLKRVENYDKVVITDARFLNELSAIRDIKGYSVTQLNVWRKPSPWWEHFYKASDKAYRDLFKSGGFMEAESLNSTELMHLSSIAQKSKPSAVHGSEVEFLLWPFYSASINNSGKLAETFEQVNKCLS